jgi:type IV secretion system protein TrbI
VSEQMAQPEHDRELAAQLRLRPEPPRVTRLSRRILIGLGGFAALAISGALIWGLYQGERKAPSTELYNTDNKPTLEGLSTLPRDYTAIPRNVPTLGPPLPGDLGRPIRNAQLTVPGPAEPAVDAEHQRITQETEAARTSRLFATTNAREQPAAPIMSPASTFADQVGAPQTWRGEGPQLDPESILNMQDRKLAFLTAAVDRRTVSRDRLANPTSPYIVQAGAVIPAALITGIRSDLPGQVTAQVTENVYDSPSGKYLLIPQGSKLVGAYDSQVSFGQDRVLLVWTRLIMPNGRSIVLERQPGADSQGFAGLEDEVDHHWGKLFAAAALSTLLGVGAELGASGNDSAIVAALRRGSADSLNQTGQQVVRRNLNIQPTLTIRPGFPVRVLVNRDLVLAPYHS